MAGDSSALSQALKYKEEGNTYFQKKDYNSAVRLYTKAFVSPLPPFLFLMKYFLELTMIPKTLSSTRTVLWLP